VIVVYQVARLYHNWHTMPQLAYLGFYQKSDASNLRSNKNTATTISELALACIVYCQKRFFSTFFMTLSRMTPKALIKYMIFAIKNCPIIVFCDWLFMPDW